MNRLVLLILLGSTTTKVVVDSFVLPSTHGGITTSPSQHHQPPETSTQRHSSFFLKESLREGDRRINKRKVNANKQQRWHRRIFSKLSRNQRDAVGVTSTSTTTSSNNALRMAVMDEDTEILLESIAQYNNQDFIIQNFHSITPNIAFPAQEESLLLEEEKEEPQETTTGAFVDSEFYDVNITPASSSASSSSPDTLNTKKSASLLGNLVENILTSRIIQHTLEDPENFNIEVEPLDNTFSKLLRGRFHANAKVSTGRLVFRPIRFSSGTLKLDEVTLNILGFLQPQSQQPQDVQDIGEKKSRRQSSGVVRYPKQFDLHIDDLTMSRHDLLFSPCVKNGLRRLLVNILQDRGVQSSSIRVSSIDIMVRTISPSYSVTSALLNILVFLTYHSPFSSLFSRTEKSPFLVTPGLTLDQHLFILKLGQVFPLPAEGMF
jgi:hypothetical protein